MTWELIGGNPAPGSPEAVRSAAAGMARVAVLAAESRSMLKTSAGRLDASVWRGTAADEFRADLDELPARLDEVRASHDGAADALRSYGDTLDQLRSDAQATLRAAQQADADRRAAVSRVAAAENELDALRSRKRGANRELSSLQTQRTAALDPVQRASMEAPVANAQSRVNRLAAEVRTAEDTVQRHQRAVEEAEGRLRRAVDRAKHIAEDLSRAVDRAVRALEKAEQDAHLPDFVERAWSSTKAWITENGPKVIKILDLAQTVLGIAALVFPPGAAFFTGASLVLGGISFAMSVAVVATSAEGFSGDRLLDLGIKFLGVAASATAFGSAAKLRDASKLATAGHAAAANRAIAAADRFTTASTWIKKTSDVAKQVQNADKYLDAYAEEGWTGVTRRAGEQVVGYVLDKGADALTGAVTPVIAAGIRDTIGNAHGDPRMHDALTSISRSMSDHNPGAGIVGVDLDRLPHVRLTQSLLGTGHVPPGGLLPGHNGAGELISHAVSGDAVTAFSEKVTGKVLDPIVGAAKDELKEPIVDVTVDAVLGEQPELVIDLPAGGGR
jgi:predicted  nucleic acid-binding Zn-ribbon protein